MALNVSSGKTQHLGKRVGSGLDREVRVFGFYDFGGREKHARREAARAEPRPAPLVRLKAAVAAVAGAIRRAFAKRPARH